MALLNFWLGFKYKIDSLKLGGKAGFKYEAFENNLKNIGPAIVLIQLTNGNIFGGFTT
jgi:hypothetical protein